MLDGSIRVPVTASLTAFHNVITETVAPGFLTNDRRKYYCPVDVFEYLKDGIFIDDEEVERWSLPTFDPVAGLPGLALEDVLVNC